MSTATRPAKYCLACANVIDGRAVVCPHCGVEQGRVLDPSVSDRRILPAFLLCFLLGVFGAHRFYVGKPMTAILQIFTLGGLGIWALVDCIFIVVGAFTDGEGRKITEWT